MSLRYSSRAGVLDREGGVGAERDRLLRRFGGAAAEAHRRDLLAELIGEPARSAEHLRAEANQLAAVVLSQDEDSSHDVAPRLSDA